MYCTCDTRLCPCKLQVLELVALTKELERNNEKLEAEGEHLKEQLSTLEMKQAKDSVALERLNQFRLSLSSGTVYSTLCLWCSCTLYIHIHVHVTYIPLYNTCIGLLHTCMYVYTYKYETKRSTKTKQKLFLAPTVHVRVHCMYYRVSIRNIYKFSLATTCMYTCNTS